MYKLIRINRNYFLCNETKIFYISRSHIISSVTTRETGNRL